MPATIKFGEVYYLIYTKRELEDMGMKPNSHILESSTRFCPMCCRYSRVMAMSRKEFVQDCYEVCKNCNTHHRSFSDPIKPIGDEYKKYLESPTDVRD